MIGWRAAGKLNAAESAGENRSVLDERNDKAKTVERMRNVRAPIGKIDCGRGCKLNPIQCAREFNISVAKQGGGSKSGNGETDRTGSNRSVIAQANLPLLCRAVEHQRLCFRV